MAKLCFVVTIESDLNGKNKIITMVEAYEIKYIETARRTLKGKKIAFGGRTFSCSFPKG